MESFCFTVLSKVLYHFNEMPSNFLKSTSGIADIRFLSGHRSLTKVLSKNRYPKKVMLRIKLIEELCAIIGPFRVDVRLKHDRFLIGLEKLFQLLWLI